MLHHYQQAQFMQSILSSFQNPYMSFIGNANPNINCVNEQYNLKQNGYYNYSNIIIDNNRDNNINRRKPSGNGIKKKMSSPGIAFNTNKFNSYIFQSESQRSEEEFISFIKSRKNNIVECLCTQRGAKDVEKILKRSSNECISILLEHININLTKVMIHVYGNYFCQKVIQISSPEQITKILTLISNDFYQIAKDYSGTHVLQALLDVISTQEQRNLIMQSIKGKEFEMSYDANATHVIQKIIQCISEDQREQLNIIIIQNLNQLSKDPNGICLVKKYIATNTLQENKKQILKTLIDNCLEISQNPYGNYAIQYVLEEWKQEDCGEIIDIIIDNIFELSKQKFSSNVVEKTIELIDCNRKDKIINKILEETCINVLIRNKFGKYVVQKTFKLMNEHQKSKALNMLNSFIDNCSNPKEKKIIQNLISNLDK